MPFEIKQTRDELGQFGPKRKVYHCDSCAMLRINGTPTHETGCPSAWQDYEIDCRECGCEFLPDERHRTVCNDCTQGEDCTNEYE